MWRVQFVSFGVFVCSSVKRKGKSVWMERGFHIASVVFACMLTLVWISCECYHGCQCQLEQSFLFWLICCLLNIYLDRQKKRSCDFPSVSLLSLLPSSMSAWVMVNYPRHTAWIKNSRPYKRGRDPLWIWTLGGPPDCAHGEKEWMRLLTDQVCPMHKLTHAQRSPRGPLEHCVGLYVSDMKHGSSL